ncbi:MAG: permease [Pseudomonadota bacterium]
MTALVQSLSAMRRGFPKIDWVLFLIFAILAGVAVLDPGNLIRSPSGEGDRGGILNIAVSALAWTSIYIALAVGLLAYLKATGAETMVAKAFQGNLTRMIFLGAMVGGLAPFCSCEVIPFIAGLLALGAPLAAVMAFWLASPVMDPAQFMITVGSLGWEYAVAKTVAAVAIGLAGGFLIRGLVAGGAFADPLRATMPKRGCGCGPDPFSGTPKWAFWQESPRVETFRDVAVEQSLFLLRWMAFAYVLEALLITYVPAEEVARLVGGEGLMPIVISAFVGMPAYLNGYAAPPMVAGLLEQGMQSGAALTFLIAGAVSSIPAMAAVWSLVKRPVFVAYLTLGLGGAIAVGVIFQGIVA